MKKLSNKKLSNFELAKAIGLRATEIARRGETLADVPNDKEYSPIEMAFMEIKQNVFPLKIRRKMPDGLPDEEFYIQELKIFWE